jgi:hypothetical protein
MSRLPDHLQPPAIKVAVQQLICTGCGAEINAACSCGVHYAPKSQRAAEYIKQHPAASVREIAEETGVGHGTAQRAKAGVPHGTPDQVSHDETPDTIGRDGKSYPATKEPAVAEPSRDPGQSVIKQIIKLFRQLNTRDRSVVLDLIDQMYTEELETMK